MISSDIAIITSSGKAYYKLVAELRKRKMVFLSLTPNDPIPTSVKVVVTTQLDKHKIDHSQVLVYDEDDDPAPLIERALQIIRGRDVYEKLVFGVDPGKRFGLAIMGDDLVVRTAILLSVADVAETILEMVNRVDAKEKVVKIGNGAKDYQSSLIQILDEELPSNVIIESVEEKGTTSRLRLIPSQKKTGNDVDSAIRISLRKGNRINRRGKNA